MALLDTAVVEGRMSSTSAWSLGREGVGEGGGGSWMQVTVKMTTPFSPWFIAMCSFGSLPCVAWHPCVPLVHGHLHTCAQNFSVCCGGGGGGRMCGVWDVEERGRGVS